MQIIESNGSSRDSLLTLLTKKWTPLMFLLLCSIKNLKIKLFYLSYLFSYVWLWYDFMIYIVCFLEKKITPTLLHIPLSYIINFLIVNETFKGAPFLEYNFKLYWNVQKYTGYLFKKYVFELCDLKYECVWYEKISFLHQWTPSKKVLWKCFHRNKKFLRGKKLH